MDDGLRHVASFRIDGPEELASCWRIKKQALYHNGRATRSANAVHFSLYAPFDDQTRPGFVLLCPRFDRQVGYRTNAG